ncbi:MAG: dihydrofolate reductase [Planctomycetes bacterium]|nr:dihydrofolate reductase [Planctomycetota bacterium]
MNGPSIPIRSIIVAVAANGVIGRDGALPWHVPADLKRFKRLTMGHHLIMGRKTLESIGRILPGRTTVVLTKNDDYQSPGAVVARSLQQAIDAAAEAGDDEVFIVGGGEIYRQALPLADRIYRTRVDATVAGDTTFPELAPTDWRVVRAESVPAEGGVPAHAFEVLERAATARRDPTEKPSLPECPSIPSRS